MKRRLLVAVLGFTLSLLLVGCAPSSQKQLPPADQRLAPVAWLAGTWVSVDDRRPQRRFEEHWTSAAGGSMLGVNRMIDGDVTMSYEFLRIVVEDLARIAYLASPEGRQPPTRFVLVESAPGLVIFENKAHDFPQRISYRRTAETTMEVEISGSEFVLEADTVVLGLGYDVDPELADATDNLKVTKWGSVWVESEETGRTSREDIWAAGDIVRGADLVVTAVAAARKAATDIHRTVTRHLPKSALDKTA